MTVDHKQNHLESVRSVLSTLVYPLQYVVNLPVAATHWFSDNVVTRQELLEENARLNEEHLKLNSRLQRFTILEDENKRLRELLESSIELSERVLVAGLIDVDLEPFRQQIIINKGRNQGAYDGQPIVDAGGIMGQIIHVGPFSSTVLFSSGLGHRFPRGYPVGTISEIVLVPGDPFSRVSVLPSANPGKSREVLLVWPYEQVQEEKPAEELATNP